MHRLYCHPSEQDLLGYVDGEIPDRRAEQIRRHLSSCWDCRTQVAQIETTIADFVSLRRKLLEDQFGRTGLRSARASRSILAARLEELASLNRMSIWEGLGAGWLTVIFKARHAWIAVAIAGLLIGLFVLGPSFIPRASANEVISQAQRIENRRPPGMVIHQRVRIRHRQKAPPSEAIVDCDFWRSANRSRFITSSLQARPASELQAIYRNHGANWEDPLSGTSFAKIRESLGDVNDQVSGRDFITVTSVPASTVLSHTQEIHRIELTVRKSDWHAVAQRIDVAGAEYEMTELLQEVMPPGSVDPAIFGEPNLPSGVPAIARWGGDSRPVATLPNGPSDEQLEAAEVLLREKLHGAGADTREFADIQRRGPAIQLELWAETAARKAEILQALDGIPYLFTQIYAGEAADGPSPASSPTPPAPAPKLYYTQPPLADDLLEYLGGIDPANNYLDEVRDSYLRVLVDASALKRLAQRYPDEQWNLLRADLRNRLNALAADHVNRIEANVSPYVKAVSLVLDRMAAKNGRSMPAPDASGRSDCESWRIATPDLLADLQGLQKPFLRLFIAERVEVPVALSARDLLDESIQARSRLQRRELCH